MSGAAAIRIDPLNTYGMAKLTLSVENSVVSPAKRYATQQGVSISDMVEAYLAAVVEPMRPRESPVHDARSEGVSWISRPALDARGLPAAPGQVVDRIRRLQ